MRRTSRINHFGKAGHGQSLVELTIAMPIIMLVLMGLLDLGRLYFVYIALEDGAGEGALFLSLNPRCRTSADAPDNSIVGECDDPNNAIWRAIHASDQDVDWDHANITIHAPLAAVGEPVRVVIQYPFRPITPIITAITGSNPINLTVEARQLIVSEAL